MTNAEGIFKVVGDRVVNIRTANDRWWVDKSACQMKGVWSKTSEKRTSSVLLIQVSRSRS